MRDLSSKDVAGQGRDDRITVRISEACRITGIGRSKLYELIATGDIPTLKVGAITLVPVEGLRTFLEGKSRNDR